MGIYWLYISHTNLSLFSPGTFWPFRWHLQAHESPEGCSHVRDGNHPLRKQTATWASWACAPLGVQNHQGKHAKMVGCYLVWKNQEPRNISFFVNRVEGKNYSRVSSHVYDRCDRSHGCTQILTCVLEKQHLRWDSIFFLNTNITF